MEEVWEVIVNEKVEKDKYHVSSRGRVKIAETGRVLPTQDNGFGYKKCAFYFKGKTVQIYIHRLVAKAFLENPENLPQVGHKDHNRENNSVENLYWTSQSQNTRDGVKAGRINSKKRGKTNRFSPSDIEFIALKTLDGYGVAEIARMLDVPRTSVSSVINGRSNWDLYCCAKKEAEEVRSSVVSEANNHTN